LKVERHFNYQSVPLKGMTLSWVPLSKALCILGNQKPVEININGHRRGPHRFEVHDQQIIC